MFTYKKHWLIDGASLGFGEDVMDLADCGNLPWTYEHKDDFDSIEHVIYADKIPDLQDIDEDKGEESAYKVFLRAVKRATDLTVKCENLAPNGSRALTEDEEEDLEVMMDEKSKYRLVRRPNPCDYMYNTLETYVPIDLTMNDVNNLDDLFEKAEIIFLSTLDKKKFAAVVKKDEEWICVNRPISVLKEQRYAVLGCFWHTTDKLDRYNVTCHGWKRNRAKYIYDLTDGNAEHFTVIDGYPLDPLSAFAGQSEYRQRRNRWFYFDDPGVRDIWFPDEETADVDLMLFFFGPNDDEKVTPKTNPENELSDDEPKSNPENELSDDEPEETPENELSDDEVQETPENDLSEDDEVQETPTETPESEPEPSPEPSDEDDDDDIPVSTVAKIKIPKN